MPLRRRILLLGQGCLSAGLLGYLFSIVDIERAGSAALRADLPLLFAGTLQFSLLLFLVAVRWQLVARALGGVLPYLAALRFVWIGAFFGQILPGAAGGDIIRMWLYWTRCGSRRLSIHSVVVERLIMLMVLLLFVLVIQPGLAERGAPFSIVISAVVLLVAIFASGVALILSRRLLAAYDQWPVFHMLSVVAEDVRELFSNISRTSILCALSIAGHLNMVITAWIIARALGLEISLADCIVLIPVIALAATLPISIGGWGVRETAAIGLLGLVGVSSWDALALSVLLGFASIIVSIPGAFLWLNLDRPRKGDFDPLASDRVD